jgi:CheY-like chemotaxis protein/anti-sigma regulatory factor (Ser/Thr protein kinase)
MTRLVDDLLDVSRATSGKISLSRGPVNLAEIAGRALATLRSAGQLDRHELHANIAPAWVHGDEARLEQVISNLVGNAVKYTPPGGTITVRVAARDGDAVFEVSDTGIGLTPELAAHVFDLFVQGDRSLDRHAGGLGIGLTLVRRLVELHDGRVDVHSEGPGRGSSFKVTLPAGPPAGRSTRDDHSSEVAPHPARRVLLIEDHDDARLSLRILLEQQGYVLAEAADGPSGLATAKEFCPDVAIVDIGLGGMDGYEVARRLRRTPESAHALLIALTGYGQEEARQQALEAGFDAHLTKPVSPLRLVELIESRLAASLGAL